MSDKVRDLNSHAVNMFMNESLHVKIHSTFVEMSSIALVGK